MCKRHITYHDLKENQVKEEKKITKVRMEIINPLKKTWDIFSEQEIKMNET